MPSLIIYEAIKLANSKAENNTIQENNNKSRNKANFVCQDINPFVIKAIVVKFLNAVVSIVAKVSNVKASSVGVLTTAKVLNAKTLSVKALTTIENLTIEALTTKV